VLKCHTVYLLLASTGIANAFKPYVAIYINTDPVTLPNRLF